MNPSFKICICLQFQNLHKYPPPNTCHFDTFLKVTYLFSKYVLSTCFILGTVLDIEDKAGNWTERALFCCVFIL